MLNASIARELKNGFRGNPRMEDSSLLYNMRSRAWLGCFTIKARLLVLKVPPVLARSFEDCCADVRLWHAGLG